MSLSYLSVLAMRGLLSGACKFVGLEVGEAAVNGVASFLSGRLNDPSQKSVQALKRSSERAWRAIEIALAGEPLTGALDRAEDRAFREQLRGLVEALSAGLPNKGLDLRRRALADLRAARKQGILEAEQPADKVARTLASFAKFTDPSRAIQAEWAVLDHIGERMRKAGYEYLSKLIQLRGSEASLLAVAVRFYFRQEVAGDPQLFQGVMAERIDVLEGRLEEAFADLGRLFQNHGDRLEGLLESVQEVVVRTHGAVLDLQVEYQKQGEEARRQFHELYQAIQSLQARLDLSGRELRPRDSLSIRNEGERQAVKQLVARYRDLPEESRRSLPALLNAVGKLQVAAGSFAEARQDFDAVARLVGDPAARGEAHFNAYLATLEQGQFDQALGELRQAVECDPTRFSPFPWQKYQPQRILGAGGFGVTFLCRYKATGGEVAVKVLTPDGLERDVSTVFQEAGALDTIQHPAIIRLRECDFADPEQRRPYLVMEYFDGHTLEALVKEQGPLATGAFLPVFLAVAEALQAAHAKGVLHRDVKPANLLVRSGASATGPWQVKVIDFGLALKQALLESAGTTTRQGRTVLGGSIAGTIDYAAPEQMGKLPGVKVGPPADVYGFGRTCCYALFGTPSPLRAHWRQVPDALADVIEGCLHEAPEQRLQGFDQVVQRLAVLTSPPPPPPVTAPPRSEPAQAEPVLLEIEDGWEEDESIARPLRVALFLASRVELTGDHRGGCEIMANVARLVRRYSEGLNERTERKLSALLDQISAAPDPAQQSAVFRKGIEEVVGGRTTDDDMQFLLLDEDPRRVVRSYLDLAVEVGGQVYDHVGARGCYEIYAAVARMIVATAKGAEDERRALRDALRECNRQTDANSRAWCLGNAMELIMPGQDQQGQPAGQGWQESQEPGTQPGFPRPVSAMLATLFLLITWGAAALVPRDAPEEGKAPLPVAGLLVTAAIFAVVIGVPGGLIIRSYRGWVFVLCVSLGIPIAIFGLGAVMGTASPGVLKFLAGVAVCTLLAYVLALPIKLVLWLARLTSSQ